MESALPADKGRRGRRRGGDRDDGAPVDRAQYALVALGGLVDLICASAPGTVEVDSNGLACLLDILREEIDDAVSCLPPDAGT